MKDKLRCSFCEEMAISGEIFSEKDSPLIFCDETCVDNYWKERAKEIK